MTSPNDVPAEIRQNSKRFFEALVARDMRGIHALYAKDESLGSGQQDCHWTRSHRGFLDREYGNHANWS
jgi:hypothetical protein